MDVVFVGLRLIHFICGIFWAGSAFFNVLLLEPAANAAGPEGGKTMGALRRAGFSTLFGIASGLTMLSGLALYGRDSGGFQMDWIGSPQGTVFTIGALAAIISGGIGGGMVGRASNKLADLGEEVGKSGGKPTPEQATQMAALKARMHTGGQINAVLLLIAVICMAIAPNLLGR